MRNCTFDQISNASREEIGGPGINITTASNQPLATKGTFLVKLDIEGLGRVTHSVIVVKHLVWPLLLGYDAMAIHGVKVDAGRSTVTWDCEGARRRAEVVLSEQEHLPPYSMRIVKACIGQKRKVGTALTLDSDHRNVVLGLNSVSRQGKTYICLVNETAEDVIGDKELLGKHIPVQSEDMVTLGELLTVQELSLGESAGPSEEKLKVIDDAIGGQQHLSGTQREELQEVLVCQQGGRVTGQERHGTVSRGATYSVSECGTSIITRANACDYERQRCILIRTKSKTDNISTSSTRKGKKAKASSANLTRFLLRFESLLSPVFGLVDGPHTPPTSD